jgi:hypothetical protein
MSSLGIFIFLMLCITPVVFVFMLGVKAEKLIRLIWSFLIALVLVGLIVSL